MKRVAVLVSGGVDSSVALRLLKDQGYDVTAFYLKIWLEDELSFMGTCPWQEDLSYVQAVCDQAQVPLEIVSLQKEYWQEVVAYTIAEIKIGRTPNPDVLCNQRVKFGAFYRALNNNFDFVATGHYAQIKHIDDRVELHMAPDSIKDQTYFLCHVTQEQLSKVLFPIGHLTKSQVRELACLYDLPNKDRKDSQGICFLGKIKFSEFINYHVGQKLGDIIEYETGKKLGIHKGFWYYTIGQRQGLGLSGGPWYVVAKDSNKNNIFVSCSYYTPEKIRDRFIIKSCNWITPFIPEAKNTLEAKKYTIKVRHGAYMHKGIVTQKDVTVFEIKLDEHDQGIASGQFAVLYDGSLCYGGGIISNVYDN